MKKLFIILLFFGCTKQSIPTYSILGTWQRIFDVYSEKYVFLNLEGSYLLQNDTCPSERVHYEFDWHTHYDTLFIEGMDVNDTIQFFVTDEALWLDHVKFVNN